MDVHCVFPRAPHFCARYNTMHNIGTCIRVAPVFKNIKPLRINATFLWNKNCMQFFICTFME